MGTARAPECRVRLRHGTVVAPADRGRWQVRWDFDEITFLEGESCNRVLPWLLPALEAFPTVAELENIAAGKSQLPELHSVLDCFDQNRFLVFKENLASGDSPVERALESMATDRDDAAQCLHHARPLVAGRSLLAEYIARSLRETGFEAASVITSIDALIHETLGGVSGEVFPIVIEQDWRGEELDQVNQCMLTEQQPWMLAGAWNRRVLVGPIVLPGQTACYACYRRRLMSHRRHVEAFEKLDRVRRTEAMPLKPEPVLPVVAELAAAWTAQEVFRFFAGPSEPRTLGRVLVYHPEEVRLNIETVLRVPWCSICSSLRCSADAAQ